MLGYKISFNVAVCCLTLNEVKSKIRVTSLAMLGYKISFNEVERDPDRLQPLLDLPPHQSEGAQTRVWVILF